MNMKQLFFRIALLVFVALTAGSVAAQEAEWNLTQTLTVSIPDFLDFDTLYPEGWSDVQRDLPGRTATARGWFEQAADVERQTEWPFAVEGYVITFEQMRLSAAERDFIQQANRTPENLQALVVQQYAYPELGQVAEITNFPDLALRLRAVDAVGNAIDAIYGFAANSLIRLMLAAPSEEALDAFLPTWETMLETIRFNRGWYNLGDYRLYLECTGEGSPTVILDHGGGVSYHYLSPVQRAVDDFTRVCVHERDVLPSLEEPRSSREFVDDLHNVLLAAGVEGPYVLAGHSYGGFNIRVYADRYPDEVLGLILIDSSHEDQDTHIVDFQRQFFSQEEIDELAQTKTEFMERAGIDWPTSVSEVAGTGSLGDLPLIVLSAGNNSPPPPPVTQEAAEQWQQEIWIEMLQADLATLSTNSTHIIVERTNHGSIVNSPEVAEAIQQVVEEVRAQSS